MLVRWAATDDSNLTVIDCVFEENLAEVDGAGIYLSFSELSSRNTILIKGTRFARNVVDKASGGAVSINSFQLTYANTFLLEDCVFEGNRGNAGGALSVALYDSNVNRYVHVHIISCNHTY